VTGPAARQAMDAAMRSLVVPRLRAAGFTGSLPHFRRRLPERIDLVTFQQFSASGSFCVEIGCCGPDGFVTAWGKEIPSGKVTAIDLERRPRNRRRLTPSGKGDHWFEYGPRDYEPEYGRVEPPGHFEKVARDVWRLVETVAEEFFGAWKPDTSSAPRK
jgi:Domain of unknown function (DUF4304)